MQGEKININVKTEKGKKFPLTVTTGTSVFKIKQLIQAKTGGFPEFLWYKGKLLKDFTATLADLGIKDGDTVSLKGPVCYAAFSCFSPQIWCFRGF